MFEAYARISTNLLECKQTMPTNWHKVLRRLGYCEKHRLTFLPRGFYRPVFWENYIAMDGFNWFAQSAAVPAMEL